MRKFEDISNLHMKVLTPYENVIENEKILTIKKILTTLENFKDR